MNASDPHDAWDDRLRATFRDAPFPPTPAFKLTGARRGVLGDARRRSTLYWGAAAGVAATAAVAVWSIEWHEPLPVEPRKAIAVSQDHSQQPAIEGADLLVLFGAPPVDSLEVLSHQQFELLAALEHIEKE